MKMTSNREAELRRPTVIGSGDWLGANNRNTNMSLKIENIRAHFEAYRGTLNESEDMAVLHLLQEVEELAKDRARLDWLESNQESVFSWTQDDQYGEPSRKLWQCHSAGLEKARDNIRDAIDAAMLPNAPAEPSRNESDSESETESQYHQRHDAEPCSRSGLGFTHSA